MEEGQPPLFICRSNLMSVNDTKKVAKAVSLALSYRFGKLASPLIFSALIQVSSKSHVLFRNLISNISFKGSYKCTCDSGYSKIPDTLECVDVDECDKKWTKDAQLNTNRCHDDANCNNTVGSYRCQSVNPHSI